MKRTMTVGYENRQSRGYYEGGTKRDLATRPKLVLANDFLKQSGFNIGDKITVQYSPGSVVISKLKP